MPEQLALKPFDVVVGLRLARDADGAYANLAAEFGVSASTVFASVARLRQAGLVRPDDRKLNRRAFTEFLEHAVRYVFPAQRGPAAIGVPTAHSAPPLAQRLVTEDVIVWPHAGGKVYGQSLTPLYPGAPELAQRAPQEYRMLALVDAIRVGGARERALAVDELKAAMYDKDAAAADGATDAADATNG